jgi:hypothetical protein
MPPRLGRSAHFEAPKNLHGPLPFAIGNVFARELAPPDGAVTALGVFRDRMRASVPPPVRRIAWYRLARRPQPLDGRNDLILLASGQTKRVLAACLSSGTGER